MGFTYLMYRTGTMYCNFVPVTQLPRTGAYIPAFKEERAAALPSLKGGLQKGGLQKGP